MLDNVLKWTVGFWSLTNHSTKLLESFTYRMLCYYLTTIVLVILWRISAQIFHARQKDNSDLWLISLRLGMYTGTLGAIGWNWFNISSSTIKFFIAYFLLIIALIKKLFKILAKPSDALSQTSIDDYISILGGTVSMLNSGLIRIGSIVSVGVWFLIFVSMAFFIANGVLEHFLKQRQKSLKPNHTIIKVKQQSKTVM